MPSPRIREFVQENLSRITSSRGCGKRPGRYVLGVMYAYGRRVERDLGQARRWLTRAVDQKVTAAQPVLASLPLPAQRTPKLQIHAAESAKRRKQQN